MQIENEFEVPAPIDHLWAHLLDVERVAPCMPGAELTETVDERTWKGKVHMKLGPVSLSFAGTVAMEERDDEAHRVVLHARGMEQKGKGAANAVVTSWLEPAGEGLTRVKMTADIQLTGSVAQLSRGLLPDVSRKLTQQFADCLQQHMEALEAVEAGAAAAGAVEAPPPPRAQAIGGIRLGLSAIWAAVVRFFRRLFGGSVDEERGGVIAAVVLAAGPATRFGATKQIATLRDKPLAQYPIDAALEAGVDEIVVVLGHDAERVREALRLPGSARWVVNPAYAGGMASSLAAGLRAADPASEAAVVLLADQPGITAQHVRALLDAFRTRRSPIVRLRFGSGPGPALLSRQVWGEAMALEGDVGARALMDRRPELVEDVEMGGDAPPDVDTPQDLERL